MSKRSIEKQRSKDKNKQEFSRRQWIKRGILGLGSLSLAGAGYFTYEKIHSPSFVEAYDDPSKRQRWLDSLETRPYVEKKIVTSNDLEIMKRDFNYEPEKIEGIPPFADTVPLEKEKACNGTKSRLYVYPESCFDPILKEFKRGQGVIVENVINNHEMIHADHFYQGISGYPTEWFFNEGNMNIPLFMAVTEIVCHRSEWQGLERIKNKGNFEQYYQSKIKDLASPYFMQISKLTDNKELIQKIRSEIWF